MKGWYWHLGPRLLTAGGSVSKKGWGHQALEGNRLSVLCMDSLIASSASALIMEFLAILSPPKEGKGETP